MLTITIASIIAALLLCVVFYFGYSLGSRDMKSEIFEQLDKRHL